MKSLYLLSSLVLLNACVQPKSTSTDYKKKPAPVSDGDSIPDGDISGPPEAPPTTFLSSWERCTPVSGSTTAKAVKETIFLVDTTEMKYQSKSYSDPTCKKELTDAELSAMYKDSNPSAKPTKTITKAFNEAMRNGEVTTGVYTAAAAGAEGTIDLTDLSGELSYRNYKISGSSMLIAKGCSDTDVSNGSTCKISGDSETNRAKDFTSVDTFTKAGSTTGSSEIGSMPNGNGVAFSPSTWTDCQAPAELKGRSIYQEYAFIDATKVSNLAVMYSDATCKSPFSDASLLTYYKELNPNATSVPPEFKTMIMSGTKSQGTYVATSATAGTLDLVNPDDMKTSYHAYKVEGTKLMVAMPCDKDDVGKFPECKAVTGDSAATRAVDFALLSIFNKK